MKTKSAPSNSFYGLLSDPRVLQVQHESETFYSAVGIVEVLTESEHAEELWNDLKLREPVLAAKAERIDFALDEEGKTVAADALNSDGVLRLIQS
ncbi:MAG TPA: hypothetical protein VKK61_02180, partial [Tepidisphaeraceae bacterium]|nr:hypothetical protein [Tepidisphaeraceae bacterium]